MQTLMIHSGPRSIQVRWLRVLQEILQRPRGTGACHQMEDLSLLGRQCVGRADRRCGPVSIRVSQSAHADDHPP